MIVFDRNYLLYTNDGLYGQLEFGHLDVNDLLNALCWTPSSSGSCITVELRLGHFSSDRYRVTFYFSSRSKLSQSFQTIFNIIFVYTEAKQEHRNLIENIRSIFVVTQIHFETTLFSMTFSEFQFLKLRSEYQWLKAVLDVFRVWRASSCSLKLLVLLHPKH